MEENVRLSATAKNWFQAGQILGRWQLLLNQPSQAGFWAGIKFAWFWQGVLTPDSPPDALLNLLQRQKGGGQVPSNATLRLAERAALLKACLLHHQLDCGLNHTPWPAIPLSLAHHHRAAETANLTYSAESAANSRSLQHDGDEAWLITCHHAIRQAQSLNLPLPLWPIANHPLPEQISRHHQRYQKLQHALTDNLLLLQRRLTAKRRHSKLPQLIPLLLSQPYFTRADIQQISQSSNRGSQLLLQQLWRSGLINEITGRLRYRLYHHRHWPLEQLTALKPYAE